MSRSSTPDSQPSWVVPRCSTSWRSTPARASHSRDSESTPTRLAIMPSRCCAAQHIAAEKVCTSSRSRYSQSPASGVNAARWASFPTTQSWR